MNQPLNETPVNPDTAKIIYVLYLAGLLTGVTVLIGLVLAYINRDTAPEWLKTHYEFQIRTFWMMLLYGIIASVLMLVFIGFLLMLILAVWWIVRCVKGLNLLGQQLPYPDPRGWGF